MRNACARLRAMVDDLEQNDNVTVLEVEMASPASREDIEAATGLAGGALPAGVADFYAELNGFNLEWRHTVAEVSQGNLADHGFVNILPIDEVFGDWEGVTWFGDSDDADNEYRPVKPFDMFVPEACAAFWQPPGKRPRRTVAYHYFGDELYDTGYAFDEYLERLLAARGFWYWIHTLCPDLQDSTEATGFRRAMPLIFDDYDDRLFQPK
ncbi:MAG TPA: hypothetical protein VFI65_29360 [Streptosporangiaceae bacterium]|nr:hypothetical protein [Streptosporangiaceae bacterium]